MRGIERLEICSTIKVQEERHRLHRFSLILNFSASAHGLGSCHYETECLFSGVGYSFVLLCNQVVSRLS